MMTKTIIILIILFTSAALLSMLARLKNQRAALINKLSLATVGIIAFICDGIGIGSFAIEIALCKTFGLIEDTKLPGLVNGAQIIPGAIEATAFLTAINVDPVTLITLVSGTCLGGILGGLWVSELDTKRIELSMGIAFSLMAVVVLCNQMHWLPIGGHAKALRHTQLWLGFIGTIFCGAMTALGVGLFALIEILLFFLGLSPLIAFPIMTTAGALQQPLTTMTFVFKNRVPLKPALWVGAFGIIGSAIAIHLVTHLSFSLLRWLLFIVVSYNAITMLKSYYHTTK